MFTLSSIRGLICFDHWYWVAESRCWHPILQSTMQLCPNQLPAIVYVIGTSLREPTLCLGYGISTYLYVHVQCKYCTSSCHLWWLCSLIPRLLMYHAPPPASVTHMYWKWWKAGRGLGMILMSEQNWNEHGLAVSTGIKIRLKWMSEGPL